MAVMMIAMMMVSLVMTVTGKRRQRQGNGKTNKRCLDGTMLH